MSEFFIQIVGLMLVVAESQLSSLKFSNASVTLEFCCGFFLVIGLVLLRLTCSLWCQSSSLLSAPSVLMSFVKHRLFFFLIFGFKKMETGLSEKTEPFRFSL